MLDLCRPVCRCLGPCLALCPEYSFILEDELGVCGCVLGVVDVRSFAKRCQASWMPAMRDKYPPKAGNTQVRTSRRYLRFIRFPSHDSRRQSVTKHTHTHPDQIPEVIYTRIQTYTSFVLFNPFFFFIIYYCWAAN